MPSIFGSEEITHISLINEKVMGFVCLFVCFLVLGIRLRALCLLATLPLSSISSPHRDFEK